MYHPCVNIKVELSLMDDLTVYSALYAFSQNVSPVPNFPSKQDMYYLVKRHNNDCIIQKYSLKQATFIYICLMIHLYCDAMAIVIIKLSASIVINNCELFSDTIIMNFRLSKIEIFNNIMLNYVYYNNKERN
ncbi:hypothetical protein H8356DRAFT_1419336 [Neocallimastix lanati (nom. inval.)]|nr:hypothetical protein H8356DRAFT_1419336 [Neocallimastix sp. JGI-2020a]